MNFTRWLQRAKINTWLIGNAEVVAAMKKAYEAGHRSGRKDANWAEDATATSTDQPQQAGKSSAHSR